MRLTGFIVLIFATSLLRAQTIVYQQPEPADFGYRRIAKTALAADIQFWHKVMEESHVNLYHAISKEQLLSMENNLLSAVKDSITQNDAVLLFGKLGAALNEGHIGLPSSHITDSLYVNSLRFPYLIQKVTDSAWVITYDISAEQILGPQSIITSVNGIPVYELNKRYQLYFGGLPSWRRQQIGSYARKLLFLDGIASPFRVTGIKNGTPMDITVQGYSKQQADSITKALNAGQTQQAAYTFEMRPDQVAYINYRNMTNMVSQPFESFLEKSFSAIREQKVKGLIIDLRENGGGNSAFGEMMAAYFTTKPYRFAGGMKWKVSEHYKAFIRKTGSNDSAYLSRPNGYLFTFNAKAKKHPVNPLRYKGKVAVLIGPDTFSSANMFADGIKTFGLAYVIGEPTAEPPNDFGEMFNFMLPNSHVIARASTKMFTRASNNEKDFNPVLPDKTVPAKAALQAAVDWVLGK